MTVQEAIEVLEVFTTEKFQCLTSSEFDDAICCAIKALEKQSKLERVINRLEEKAEECKKYWDKFDDEDAFGGMNAYMNSIAIIKEELM